MTEHHVICKPAAAVAGADVVSGAARYTTDIAPPGTLVGRMLYTPHPHALVRAVDTSAASRIDGVVAVLTAADIPGPNSFMLYDTDQPLMIEPGEHARFQGDVLAIVAAKDESSAQAALDAIRVDCDPLPGVFDALEAVAPGAPQVWPDRDNVYRHLHVEKGDPDQALRDADVVVVDVYRTQCMEQAFLEPEGAVAVPNRDGTITVYAGCQAPFRDRRQIARSLALRESQVRVVVPPTGGAFGGKDETHVQIHTALLAQATGRPVRLIRSREESILTHVKRHPITIRYRTGATRDGRLAGIVVEAHADGGPYANMTAQVMEVFTIHASGPYAVRHARIDAYSVLTNSPTGGAMRGFGMPQAAFACERQMDRLARELDIDPVELRRINAVETGAKLATGVTALDAKGMRESLDAAAEMIGWTDREDVGRQPAPHLRRGWGIAATMQGYLLGPKVTDAGFAGLELHDDGSVVLRTGIVDYGQGSHTVQAQIAAEALGVELADVRVIGPDTDKTLEAGSACASRVTFICGHAVLRAAAPIRAALLKTAADMTGRPEADLAIRANRVHVAGEPTGPTVAEVVAAARRAGRETASVGHYSAEYPAGIFDDDVFDNPCGYYTFGAKAVQVLVDVETGELEVERMCLVIDAGRVLNPPGALGQAEGGALQGYGYAVMEELVVEAGRTRNPSLEAYLIPTVRDVPPTEVRFLDSVDKYGPYGARGLAEIPVVPAAPAIANAIADAVGAECRRLPMTAERVLAEIDAATSRELTAA